MVSPKKLWKQALQADMCAEVEKISSDIQSGYVWSKSKNHQRNRRCDLPSGDRSRDHYGPQSVTNNLNTIFRRSGRCDYNICFGNAVWFFICDTPTLQPSETYQSNGAFSKITLMKKDRLRAVFSITPIYWLFPQNVLRFKKMRSITWYIYIYIIMVFTGGT